MRDKQKTAVQYLKEQLKMILPMNQFNDVVVQDAFNQAKELFKQQIIDARLDACIEYSGTETAIIMDIETSEQYFNETFKTESNGK